METNIVQLDLNVYNELRDFKDNFTKENTLVIKNSGNYAGYSTYITESHVIKELETINRTLSAEIELYQKRVLDLTNSNNVINIENLTKKGLFGIIKWWFKNK